MRERNGPESQGRECRPYFKKKREALGVMSRELAWRLLWSKCSDSHVESDTEHAGWEPGPAWGMGWDVRVPDLKEEPVCVCVCVCVCVKYGMHVFCVCVCEVWYACVVCMCVCVKCGIHVLCVCGVRILGTWLFVLWLLTVNWHTNRQGPGMLEHPTQWSSICSKCLEHLCRETPYQIITLQIITNEYSFPP